MEIWDWFNAEALILVLIIAIAGALAFISIFGYLLYALVTKGWSDTFDPPNHNKGVLKIVRSGIRSSRMLLIIGLFLVFFLGFRAFCYCSGYAFRRM